MKRLIVDDLRDLPIEGTVVRNSNDAIAALEGEGWDEIWLDYDLGGKPYETDDALTIMPFVDRLVDDAQLMSINLPTIFVHTQNPVGRQRIKAALQRYYTIIDVMLLG